MSTIPRHLGKYELQRQLGRGTVGEVWKGYDAQLNRDVAIKTIHTDLQSDPNFMTRFTTEGKTIASLQHANIVPVRDVDISRPPEANETTAYIVMDYVEGPTLADFLRATSHKGNFPSVAQIVYLFTSLGVAIDYAHQRGIVHGNIKPSNILLNRKQTAHFEAGEPMLVDFGLAQLLGSAAGVSSPLYMSPEQAKGQPANNRSDIYSLGVILYELCTGIQPFRDESSVAVMMQHINVLPTPPSLINPNIPGALSEVILRAMAKDTATRFPIASLLATAIADACSIQSTLNISPHKAAIAGDEELTYQGGNDGSVSILGVPQPKTGPRRPPTSQPLPTISQPFPVVSRPLPAVSRPLPAVSQPLPTVSGPMPAIPGATTRPIPAASVPSTPVQTTQTTLPTIPISKITGPFLPIDTPPLDAAMAMVPASARSLSPLPPPPPPSFPTPTARSRRHLGEVPVYIVITVFLLLLLVIGSAISANLFLNHGGQTAAGHIFFQDDALGHDDVLRIEMQNMPAPPQGKSYFAWLQDSSNHTLPLGEMNMQNGSISFTYPGDSKHTNLISIAQGFLITEEDSGSQPTAPTGATVYRAAFDTMALQYIKNILYATPGLPAQQSVIDNLFETIKSMNDKAGSIVDVLNGSHDYGMVRRQAIRIIELVDGTAYARSSGDLPASDPALIGAKIGLLSSPTQIGYIDLLSQQLDRVQQVDGNDPALSQHIQNVRNAIADLRDWVQKIRTDDVQLVKAASLTDPAIIGVALRIRQVAADSYTGRTIPPNEGPQPTPGSAGAYQGYVECQYMATLALKKV